MIIRAYKAGKSFDWEESPVGADRCILRPGLVASEIISQQEEDNEHGFEDCEPRTGRSCRAGAGRACCARRRNKHATRKSEESTGRGQEEHCPEPEQCHAD